MVQIFSTEIWPEIDVKILLDIKFSQSKFDQILTRRNPVEN